MKAPEPVEASDRSGLQPQHRTPDPKDCSHSTNEEGWCEHCRTVVGERPRDTQPTH